MTIKEVSTTYHVSESTLRYYEKEGLLFKVPKKGKNREYEEKNIKNLEFVLCMRKSGMSMERLKKYIKLFEIPKSEKQRKEILEEQKEELITKINELQESLNLLNYKIENYEELLGKRKEI